MTHRLVSEPSRYYLTFTGLDADCLTFPVRFPAVHGVYNAYLYAEALQVKATAWPPRVAISECPTPIRETIAFLWIVTPLFTIAFNPNLSDCGFRSIATGADAAI